MIKEIIMPKLGETMEEGYLLNWLKKEGEKVTKGEPPFEVSSDQTNVAEEAEKNGHLRKILVQPTETPIPVTKVIGYLSDSVTEELPETKSEGEVKKENKERISISPLAKRLAKEKGIDLTKIKGTGAGGRIEKDDLLKISRGNGDEEFERKSLTGTRKIIARRMSESKKNIPHYYLQAEIEMEAITKLKEEQKFSYTDFILRASAKALSDFPLMNAIIIGEEAKIYKKINIGLAILGKKGLLVPVIRNLEKKSLAQISQERISLKEKAEQDKLSPDDLRGGTFTISNLGVLGVDNFAAIINPPEVGILALGKIKEIPVVAEGKIQIKKVMRVTLSADHRLIDGAYSAQFLNRIKEILENPKE